MKKEEEIKVYEKSIEELRRMHDEVTIMFNIAKVRIITFMGGGFAFLSFIYATKGELFIPDETYGKIFYSLGLALCITALILLFIATRGVQWRIPTESKKHDRFDHKNYLEYLKYTKREYVEAFKINHSHNEKKQSYLNFASSLLMTGALILIVIRNFN